MDPPRSARSSNFSPSRSAFGPPPTATDPWRHAYFRQIPIEQAIRFSFERHTVYQFTPLLGGMYDLDVFRLVTGPDGPTLEWAPAPGSPASGFSI